MRRDRGKHNESKCKVLMVLYEQEASVKADKPHFSHWNGMMYAPCMTVRDIHWRSGVPLATLTRSLGKWLEWGMIEGLPVLARGNGNMESRQALSNIMDHPAWAYRITDKGVSWLRNYAQESLNIGRFKQEIFAFRELNPNEQPMTEDERIKRMAEMAGAPI